MSTNKRPHVYVDDEIVYLNTHKEVCPECRGEGTHVNRAIDGFSTSDECWADDEFRENYFGGVYDVTCTECDGLRVIDIVDEDANDPELVAQWLQELRWDAEDEYTRWAESGYPH